jgi:hypothetical protein
VDHGASLIETARRDLRLKLGKWGFKSYELSNRKGQKKRQQYSMSLIAAIS